MSFGFGLGDLIVVSKFAWSLYRACRDSSEDFRRISTEIGSLHVVLRETEDFVRENPQLDAERRRRLSVLLDGCQGSLKDLQKLLDSYESLGTQSQRTWDRMRWGLEDLSDVRSRLIANATLLGAFTSTLANSSTTRMEKRLEKFITEVKAGLREGSVVSAPDAAETIDSPGVWQELRRELEDMGISEVVIEENKVHIKSWFKTVLQQAQTPDADDVLSLGGDDALTLVASCDESVSGTPEMGIHRRATVANMTSANEEFAKELRRRGAGQDDARAMEDSFGALALGEPTTDDLGRRKSSSASSLLVKKKAGPTRMLMKLLKKDDAIIEAASDGDIAKVAKLISLGMDVNARDRWGWSALSMCGYGGYTDIARLLLDHGADMDNVDVDGETPEHLATNRGNREMVLLFEEERAARDLKAKEMDKEKPRLVEM